MRGDTHLGSAIYNLMDDTYRNPDGSDVRTAAEQHRRDMERMKDLGRRLRRDYESRVIELLVDPDPVGRIFRAAEEMERRR